MKTVQVRIGVTSGPVTDVDVSSDFTVDQIPLIADVLAMVNRAEGSSRWYYRVDDGTMITPVTNPETEIRCE